MTKNVSIILECGHMQIFHVPPQNGESIWCLRCVGMKAVTNAPPRWKSRCASCGFSREHGAGRSIAIAAGDRHLRTHPSHEMKIIDGYKVDIRFGNCDQTVIPMMPERDLENPRSE